MFDYWSFLALVQNFIDRKISKCVVTWDSNVWEHQTFLNKQAYLISMKHGFSFILDILEQYLIKHIMKHV